MSGCVCQVPVEKSYDKGSCKNCGRLIDHRHTSNDATFQEFFGQLAALPDVPAWFIREVSRRELVGRPLFGHSFLSRANAREGIEEAADLALYSRLHLLRCRREGRREQTAMALQAAHLAAKAATILAELHKDE